MRWCRTVAVGVALLALATPAAAAPVVLTDGELGEALLKPADVPEPGWGAATGEAFEPEPHTLSNATSGGWCGGVTDGHTAESLTPRGNAVTVLSKTPAGPEQPLSFIWERLLSFGESDRTTAVANAKRFIARTKKVIRECPTGWQTSGGEVTNSNTPAVVPFPNVGNQRLRVTVTIAGDGVTAQTDVVYVRVANNVAIIHTRILPPDDALLTKIVKRAAKKLKQVAAT